MSITIIDDIDEHCPAEKMANGEPNIDHSHCQCWWDGDACCRCHAAPLTSEQKQAQGME